MYRNLGRIGFLGLVFAISVMAQDVSPTAPLTHRGITGPPIPAVTKPETVTLPAETEVNVQVLSGIHTKVNRVDDPILARVLEPVYISGKVVLPPGSLLDGRITMIRNSGHLRRPAELGLRFDRITLPDGQEKPIWAVLAALEDPDAVSFHLDSEGHLAGNKASNWKLMAGGFSGIGTFAALRIAAVTTSGVSLALPIGGAALVGYETLWRRGHEVNVPPDTHCRVRLSYPLTLRIPW